MLMEDGKDMPPVRMRLGATQYFVQAGHHRTAIEAAIEYVNAGFAARFRPEQTDDMVLSEFASIEHQWVVETIYQGAYLRDFHLWEKSCREYFSSLGVQIPKSPKPSFTEYVQKRVLSSHFGLDVPQDVMDALGTMRSKVNRMKHEEGVQADESVSAEDYSAAVAAIERFWEFLHQNERYSPPGPALIPKEPSKPIRR
jgi:hypothetical protein